MRQTGLIFILSLTDLNCYWNTYVKNYLHATYDQDNFSDLLC